MCTGPIDRSLWVGVSEAGGVCWPGKRTCPINSNTGEAVVTHAQKGREGDVDGQQEEEGLWLEKAREAAAQKASMEGTDR